MQKKAPFLFGAPLEKAFVFKCKISIFISNGISLRFFLCPADPRIDEHHRATERGLLEDPMVESDLRFRNRIINRRIVPRFSENSTWVFDRKRSDGSYLKAMVFTGSYHVRKSFWKKNCVTNSLVTLKLSWQLMTTPYSSIDQIWNWPTDLWSAVLFFF